MKNYNNTDFCLYRDRKMKERFVRLYNTRYVRHKNVLEDEVSSGY